MQTISENINLSGCCFFLKFCIYVSELSLCTETELLPFATAPFNKERSQRLDNRPCMVGVLLSLAPGQERVGMICTVMEAVLQYAIPSGLVETAKPRTIVDSRSEERKAFVLNHKSSMKLQQWSLVKVIEPYTTVRGEGCL
jgi:hypothetical protein